MTVVCGICGREFEDEAAMDAHEHEPEASIASDAEALRCMVCGESFGREEDLVRHQSEDHVGVDLPDEEQAVP
jgi:DNA-directed RNA polymerase subunit RPC12/RpoP